MGHRVEARIVSTINVNEGNIAKVKGHIYCEGKKVIKVIKVVFLPLPWSLRQLQNTFPFTSAHAPPTSPLSLDLPLILMVLGPALPPVDMWRTLAQGATQTAATSL